MLSVEDQFWLFKNLIKCYLFDHLNDDLIQLIINYFVVDNDYCVYENTDFSNCIIANKIIIHRSCNFTKSYIINTRFVNVDKSYYQNLKQWQNDGYQKSYQRITANEKITKRLLYRKPTEFQPKFDFMLYTNYQFRIRCNDHGTWRRIKKYRFT